MSELYPSKEALDASMESGVLEGACEQHEQLDELFVAIAETASAG